MVQIVAFKTVVSCNNFLNAKRWYKLINDFFFSKIDDDDDDFGDNDTTGLNGSIKSREEKRRLSHTAAEQKRRNAIKVSLNYTVNSNVS